MSTHTIEVQQGRVRQDCINQALHNRGLQVLTAQPSSQANAHIFPAQAQLHQTAGYSLVNIPIWWFKVAVKAAAYTGEHIAYSESEVLGLAQLLFLAYTALP